MPGALHDIHPSSHDFGGRPPSAVGSQPPELCPGHSLVAWSRRRRASVPAPTHWVRPIFWSGVPVRAGPPGSEPWRTQVTW